MLSPCATLMLKLKVQSVTGPNLGNHFKRRNKPLLAYDSPWLWGPVAQVLLWNGGDVVRFSAPPEARQVARSNEAVIKFYTVLIFLK